MSFINYDFTVALGLQESENDIGIFGVAVNKSFGVGDTLVYVPLLFAGLIGLWLRKKWGIFLMICALAITMYWPVVCIFIILFSNTLPGFNYPNLHITIMLLILITIYGGWGLWYLFKTLKC